MTKAQSGYLRANDTTEFHEYFFDKGTLGGALITISGRYPESGMAMNEVSDELAYITRGTGSLSTENSTAIFRTGVSLYLTHDEKFKPILLRFATRRGSKTD